MIIVVSFTFLWVGARLSAPLDVKPNRFADEAETVKSHYSECGETKHGQRCLPPAEQHSGQKQHVLP
ncbi:hypothetical protein ABZ589_37705, partial [Streptomyces sp. NPDC013313]